LRGLFKIFKNFLIINQGGLFMKRLSIALAAIGISAGALAALPAATNPTEVSVPQLSGGFAVGVTGFYLQPSDSNGDLDYASSNVNNNSIAGTAAPAFTNVNLHNVNPGYDWGWGVNVGYIFPNTGNDVNLSYFNYRSDKTSSTSVAGFNFSGAGAGANIGNFILPVGLTPSNFDAYQTATAKVDYDLDQVDLTAGQFINVGCRLTLHPFAGLRWAQLDRKLTENYFAPGLTSGVGTLGSTLNNGTLSLVEKSDFDGIGPIAGLDASYYVDQGFGVVGHFDTGVLVGNIHSSTNEAMVGLNSVTVGSSTPPATFNATYSASSINRLVPVADAKLGVDWTYLFNNTENSDLTLEAGWQVNHYWNAVDRLTIVDGTGAAITGRKTSDFGTSGPYLNVTMHV
jgi:hypothetical protein